MSVYITKDKQDAYCKELTQRETRVLLSLERLCFSNVIMVQRIFRTTALRVANGSRKFSFIVKRLEIAHYENRVTNERQKLLDK